MNFNNKCVNNMCKLLGLGILLMIVSCNSASKEDEVLFTIHYPELYEAVFARDDSALIAFTQDTILADQAWRALISTPVTSIDTLISLAKEANSDAAWMAVSLKSLTDEQLVSLQEDYISSPDLRAGISRVLGRAGNRFSLIFLLDRLNTIRGNSFEYFAAQAIGRQLVNEDIDEERMTELFSVIMQNDSSYVVNEYLYGFYRANKVLDTQFSEQLLRKWDVYDNKTQQILIRILSHNHMAFLTNHYLNDRDFIDTHHAVELSRVMTRLGTDENGVQLIRKLLNSENRSVRFQTMRDLAISEQATSKHPDIIQSLEMLVDDEGSEAVIRLEAARTLSQFDELDLDLDVLKELSNENPYYLQTYLFIKSRVRPDEMLLSCSGEEWEKLKTDDLRLFFGVNSINSWFSNAEEDVKENNLEAVQECIQFVLEEGSRSLVLAISGLIRDKTSFPDFEYPQLEAMYERFSLPADVELYQSTGQLLFDRFKSEATAFIDSMAAYGNSALNQSYKNQGWEIDWEGENKVTFREPDWERLAFLGKGPILYLKTDQGDISIRLRADIAPATVSSVDSLVQAGAYDGVAFHRVVQNFVIQGGDIETGNGWGGPNYVLPTEGSERGYKRGEVGIASSGRDTEGSQYFIMHRPAPHLNGLYTNFGSVMFGMEAVEKMIVGDKVIKADLIESVGIDDQRFERLKTSGLE